jgi:hypothetical protein
VDTLLLTPLAFLSLITCVNAMFRMIRKKQVRAAAWCCVFAIASAPLMGLVQIDKSVHATYLQLFGVNIAIKGKACANPRDEQLWWRR